MSKADKAVSAAKEICDIVELITNDVDNSGEITKFFTETMEAGTASYMLAKDLTKSEYADALGVIGAAVGGKLVTDRVVFDDGSGIAVSLTALGPSGDVTRTEIVGSSTPSDSTHQPGDADIEPHV